jgi:pimeloyl-ACP methyl ester carboxylesterase
VNDPRDAITALQVETLCLRLAAQRALIAERIGTRDLEPAFPRSATMRLLLRHPALVARVIAVSAGVAGRPTRLLLVGAALALVALARADASTRR